MMSKIQDRRKRRSSLSSLLTRQTKKALSIDQGTREQGEVNLRRMKNIFPSLLLWILLLDFWLFAGPCASWVSSDPNNSGPLTLGATDRRMEEDSLPSVPLVDVGTVPSAEDRETSKALVSALRTSGFALVRSPLLSTELQSRAIHEATIVLDNTRSCENQQSKIDVIPHPQDPKVYAMIDCCNESLDGVGSDNTIQEYVRALRSIKMDVLRLIAMGLDLVEDVDFLAKLHNEDNDTLRLITYFPTHSEDTGNRCKEHSDYGTITLLSTDGVSGLELFHNGKWEPVPYVEGALVVNVGSLLSGWTRGVLKATLHRVAGPASLHSGSDPKILLEAVHRPRTSIAFFADPNKDVSESLAATQNDALKDALKGMSVAEYIRWRSGGEDAERSGVSFTAEETELLRNDEQRPSP